MGDKADKINTRSGSKSAMPTTTANSTPAIPPITSLNSSVIDHNFLINMEKRIISSINSLLEQKIDALKKGILAQVSEQFAVVHNRLKSLDEEVSTLKSKVATVCESNTKLEVEVRRLQRGSDVVITGIPVTVKENALDIYKCIATKLNIAVSPFTNAFRVKKRNNNSNSSSTTHTATSSGTTSTGPLIVKLSCIAEQKALFSALRSRGKPFTLRDIDCGFITENRIGIFESLLPEINNIRKEAIRLRKQSKLQAVKVSNGAVHVKKSSEADFTIVNCLNQLL